MNVRAGRSDNEHSHRAETVYFISGRKVKIHLPDDEVMEADNPDGRVMWHEEWTHRVEDVGTKDVSLNQPFAVHREYYDD